MNEHFEPMKTLSCALGVLPGVTAIVGGGGKTSVMLRLAGELSMSGSVIVTTTTHIWKPMGMPTLLDPGESDIERALHGARVVCVGSLCEDNKLAACAVSMERLSALADYVLVEADGAKRLPLKAPAAHEPVIPACANHVVAVAGLDGVGKPIRQAAFRPELYAKILHVDLEHVVTPADAATVLCSPSGQRKGVRGSMDFSIVLNKADDGGRLALAAEACTYLDRAVVAHAAVTCLEGSETRIDRTI